MSTLARLQRELQQHVLDGDTKILDAVNDSERVPASTRLAIYAEAYRLRLIEALAGNVPRLQELLGSQQFSVLAQLYIAEHPSRFASVRWFGDRLGDYLAQAHPAEPWLAELAHWEWAVAAAFDARDAQPVGFEALAQFTPDDWPALTFDLHPSVQQLETRTNAPALFKALTEEQAPPQPALLEQPQGWLIWRQELKTQYRSVAAGEAAALTAVRAGGTFEDLCELLCNWHDAEQVPTQAASLLKGWLAEALLVGVQRAAT